MAPIGELIGALAMPTGLRVGSLAAIAVCMATVFALAALRLMHSLGHPRCFLWTDDFRLPALNIYLRLGFQPAHTHDSHPERWREVYRKLGLQPP